MLLYLSGVQSLLTAFAYIVPWSNTAIILSTYLLSALWLVCGYPVHPRDLPQLARWLRYVSPAAWLLPTLTNREYTQEAISSSAVTTLCRNKQVTDTETLLLTTTYQRATILVNTIN